MAKHDNFVHNPFSLIADFDGDIRELFTMRHTGTLPVLPLRNMVLFPGVVAPIQVGRASSLAIVDYVQKNEGKPFIAVAAQVDPDIEVPTMLDLFPVATLARIIKVMEGPEGAPCTIIVQAYNRIELDPEPYRMNPFIRTKAEDLDEKLPDVTNRDWCALFDTFREKTFEYLESSEEVSQEAIFAVKNIHNPFFFVNFVATNLPVSVEDKALLLDEPDFQERTLQILRLIQRELRYVELRKKIQQKTNADLDKQQREIYLQQQMRNIQSELGGDENSDAAGLRAKAEALELPANIRELFERELAKMQRQNPASPDYNVLLSYLETLVSLPWGKLSSDDINLARARRILDRDHYGMEKVKERILEYLAIMQYTTSQKAPILCLYGPPGVGKTSLGRSIAESLGRKYVRMSLGGVHDEAEIRGHRRTYIGAMCGRVMKNIIKSGTSNPVFILDEIDKVTGRNHNGDPQSALLELLDPEQNSSFHDNYLDFDYDLSRVFFIATANNIADIPLALRDRMELIEVEGYITEEKQEIAKRHLIPDAQKELTLPHSIRLTPSATEFLIEHYTRESGVRMLQKNIEKIVRKVVLEASEKDGDVKLQNSLKPADIERLLGRPKFTRDIYQGNRFAGVVTGLAWTAVGGEILFVETSLARSKAPQLTITGNLGDVMKESATIALQYVKANASLLGIDPRIFAEWSLHIHVPEGATPKDGPSAGITIATSIASAITQRKVRKNIAMTGEITLRGRVLPVGGIKEKILAAKRAGITDIILSVENHKDIDEIAEKYLKGLTFHFVETVADVWKFALLNELVDEAQLITVSNEAKQ